MTKKETTKLTNNNNNNPKAKVKPEFGIHDLAIMLPFLFASAIPLYFTDTTSLKDIYIRGAIFVLGVFTMGYAMWQQGVKSSLSRKQEALNNSLKEDNELLNKRVTKLEQFIRDSHTTTSNYLELHDSSGIQEKVETNTSTKVE